MLRMYHMFPYRRYLLEHMGIDDMTAYIPEVARMGYNAVWMSPLQATGTLRHLHPDGQSEVSGSLYAMADDEAFNPLIFPDCKSKKACEEKLRQWTATVRLNGMFPLFDLVANHVGINAGDEPTPLQSKLGEDLLLQETHERWPDIQCFDYYKTGTKSRGVNTDIKQLDLAKIDRIFETLWVPFITRYIIDYGFMGVRVDALTHVPARVQRRLNQLVQQLVLSKFGTNAIIVGELMVPNPEAYSDALSTCMLTHCLHPCGFYWGHNTEGGYRLDGHKPFIDQSRRLAEIVLSPPPLPINEFENLLIEPKNGQYHPKTIYITCRNETHYHIQFNVSQNDIRFGKAVDINVRDLAERRVLLRYIKDFRNEVDKDKHEIDKEKVREIKRQIWNFLSHSTSLRQLRIERQSQVNRGGIMGVVGNHDVSTLQAKIMLDIAYSRAKCKAGDNDAMHAHIESLYYEFKDEIKGVRTHLQLAERLRDVFGLHSDDLTQLHLDLPFRKREKIFIQAMMCFGGWYSLAGDEVSICHKPEVFEQFARDPQRVSVSLRERFVEISEGDDLRTYIAGINRILSKLPAASYQDYATMHYTVVENEEFGKKNSLFLIDGGSL